MKTVKRTGIIIAILIILIIPAAVFVSVTYDEAVIKYLKKYLDKHLITEIEVNKINFSLLKNFPNASVELKNILAKSTLNFSAHDFNNNTDTLLTARSIFFEFGLLKILKGEYTVRNIHIIDGTLNIFIDSNGRTNYKIWDPGDKKSGSPAIVDLQSIVLTDINLHVSNIKEKYSLSAFGKKTVIKGSLSNSVNSLLSKGSFNINNFALKNKKIFEEKAFNFETDLMYQNNNLKIRYGKIKLGSLYFKIDGDITRGSPGKVNLTISDGKVKLSEILWLFENNSSNFLNTFSISGNTYFNSTISGSLSKDFPPDINSGFFINNGTIINKKTKVKLSGIKLKGTYTNGKQNNSNTSSISIEEFHTSDKNITLNGKLTINNFNSPGIQLRLDSDLELDETAQFINLGSPDFLDGKLNAKVDLNGSLSCLSKISKEDFLKLTKECRLTFFNTSFKISGYEFIIDRFNGDIYVSDNIRCNNLSFIIDNNDFLINGIFNNVFDFFLLKNKNLVFNTKVSSEYLDLKSLLSNLLYSKNKNSTSERDYSKNIYFKTDLSIKDLKYDKFNAANISSVINYTPGTLSFRVLQLNSFDGSISGHGSFSKKYDNYIMQCQSELKSIDINKFFYSFNNFSQNFIVDDNIKGNLSGNVDFSAVFDKKLNIAKESITADGNLIIKNGELIQFEPLMGLSKFISVEELKHIKFKTLNNEILIKDKVITIPEMDIYSSAINITALGVHKFDNSFDYRIKVSLTELLFNKARKKSKEINNFGIVEDDGLGTISIPLKISGTGDKYETSFDRQTALGTLKNNIQREKKVLKDIFKDELYDSGKDSLSNKNLDYNISWEDQYDKKDVIFENQDIKKEDTGEYPDFIIEWDENEDDTD